MDFTPAKARAGRVSKGMRLWMSMVNRGKGGE